MEDRPPQRQVVRLGVLITAPRGGDCTCVFCALYRRGHFLRRAVLASAAAVIPFALAAWAAPAAHSTGVGYATQVVGGLLLAGTVAVVLAICSWWSPGRRTVHRHHPRVTHWPPD